MNIIKIYFFSKQLFCLYLCFIISVLLPNISCIRLSWEQAAKSCHENGSTLLTFQTLKLNRTHITKTLWINVKYNQVKEKFITYEGENVTDCDFNYTKETDLCYYVTKNSKEGKQQTCSMLRDYKCEDVKNKPTASSSIFESKYVTYVLILSISVLCLIIILLIVTYCRVRKKLCFNVYSPPEFAVREENVSLIK